jgi:hypothetical protein
LNRQSGGPPTAEFFDFDSSADWQYHGHDPYHIFAHEQHRFNDSQWNIGLTAGLSPADDFVRIGLGFVTDGVHSNGRISYEWFTDRVKNNPAGFDRLMQQMAEGGYIEFDGQRLQGVNAAWVLGPARRSPMAQARWRFIGEKLPGSLLEFCSKRQFVTHCLDVWENFLQAGFPARY